MLIDDMYVVFDLETTGLKANEGDSIIEIGAVKMQNGKIIDTFDLFVDPKRNLDPEIIKITGITNEMLKDSIDEKSAVEKFMDFVGDCPVVAHNAKFDMSFINMAYLKYDLGRFNNTIIDTLGLSRYLESNQRFHNLATLVIRYNIPWDEDKHHRANYDAEGTALIFYKMLEKLKLNNINTMDDLKQYRTIVLKYNNKNKKWFFAFFAF